MIRPLRADVPSELDLVVERSIATVLETIPEFGNDLARAQQHLPNLDHGQMRAMYLRDQTRPTHRFLVAEAADGDIVGHVIFFVREAAGGPTTGYLFTMYVAPERRRTGLGSALARAAFDWFREQGVDRVDAHTHTGNEAALRLAGNFGLRAGQRTDAPWPHVALSTGPGGAGA